MNEFFLRVAIEWNEQTGLGCERSYFVFATRHKWVLGQFRCRKLTAICHVNHYRMNGVDIFETFCILNKFRMNPVIVFDHYFARASHI